MKAVAWIAAALIQVALIHMNLFDALQGVADSLFTSALHLIEKHPSPWNWFYEAILIGHDEGLRARPTLQAFFTLGLYHLIVVSGSHVLALEKLIQTLTFWLPPKWQKSLVLISLLLFTFVNRLQASCVRALVSWVFSKVKTVRPIHNADIQMIVTCLCLILEPKWASSLSFQLSCGATLGLAMASSLQIKSPWKRRMTSTILCSIVTAPLIFCVQACLSWLIIPANVVGMPLFEGLLMPVSLFNVFIPRLAFLTEPVFHFVFGFSDFMAAFDHPLLCIDERRLQFWGLCYIAWVYGVWRWWLPYFLRRRFVTSQFLMKPV